MAHQLLFLNKNIIITSNKSMWGITISVLNVKDGINFIEIDFKIDNFMWVLKSDCVK